MFEAPSDDSIKSVTVTADMIRDVEDEKNSTKVVEMKAAKSEIEAAKPAKKPKQA